MVSASHPVSAEYSSLWRHDRERGRVAGCRCSRQNLRRQRPVGHTPCLSSILLALGIPVLRTVPVGARRLPVFVATISSHEMDGCRVGAEGPSGLTPGLALASKAASPPSIQLCPAWLLVTGPGPGLCPCLALFLSSHPRGPSRTFLLSAGKPLWCQPALCP